MRFRFKRYAPLASPPPPVAWLLLAVCVLGTLGLWNEVRRSALHARAARFERRIESGRSELDSRLGRIAESLTAGRGLFSLERDVSRREWDAFVRPLAGTGSAPGAWIFVAAVERDRMWSFERAVRAGGVQGFKVRTSRKTGTLMVVQHATDGEARLRGADISGHLATRQALERARDEGTAAVVPGVPWCGDSTRAEAAVFVPVFGRTQPSTADERRAATVGWIGALVALDGLFAGLADSVGAPFTMYSGWDPDPEACCWGSPVDEAGGGRGRPWVGKASAGLRAWPAPPRYHDARVIAGGERWLFRVPRSAAVTVARPGPSLYLGVGLLAGLLVFAVIWSVNDRHLSVCGRADAAVYRVSGLEDERRRLDFIVSRVNDAVILTSGPPGMEIRWVNDAFTRLTGRSRDAMRGRSLRDAFGESPAGEEPFDKLRECLAANRGVTAEIAGTTRSGHPFWVRLEAQPLFGPDRANAETMLVLTDITRTKESETALERSENRARTLVETSNEIIAYLSPNAEFLFVNPAVHDVLGYRPDEVCGESLFELTPSDQHDRINSGLETVLLEPAGTVKLRFLCRAKEGSLRTLEASLGNHVEDPGLECMVLRARDVTEQHHAEMRMREQEHRLRSALEAVPDAMFLQDAEGRVELFNTAAGTLLGSASDRIHGAELWTVPFLGPDGSPLSPDRHPSRIALDSGRPSADIRMGRPSPEGNTIWYRARSTPLLRPGTRKPYALATVFSEDVPARDTSPDEAGPAVAGAAPGGGTPRSPAAPPRVTAEAAAELKFRLQRFLDVGDRCLDELRAALEAGAMDAAAGVARRLKDACMSIGAARVGEVCERVLIHLGREDLDGARTETRILEERFESLRTYCRNKWLRGAA